MFGNNCRHIRLRPTWGHVEANKENSFISEPHTNPVPFFIHSKFSYFYQAKLSHAIQSLNI
jgi:hypothetical protein